MEINLRVRIPETVVDDIRQKSDIIAVISRYVQLKKVGTNYSGLCPFHKEKTPSFSISEEKKIYHCFGCGCGGTIFRFVQEIEGVSFIKAVIKVADMTGIILPEGLKKNINNFSENPQKKERIQFLERTTELYNHILVNTKLGKSALEYLLKRNITEEIIQEFQIGFSPNQRNLLEKIFQKGKINQNIYEETGLFIQKKDGNFIDRFSQRIMFPIRNSHGETIGFSGRYFETKEKPRKNFPKYMNTPETELFNKRNILFNLDKAKNKIRKEQKVFLFEGVLDVISAWKSGIQNSIASLGTSLTNNHINTIERIANELVLCYDGDSAGMTAVNKIINTTENRSKLTLSVVPIPNGLDPNDYLNKFGSTFFKDLFLNKKQTTFSFKMNYRKLKYNIDNENEKFSYIQEVLKDLNSVNSLIEQDYYLNRLSTELKIDRYVLNEEFRYLRKNNNKDKVITTFSLKKKNRLHQAEELLLHRLFNKELRNDEFKAYEVIFPDECYQKIYFLFDTFIKKSKNFIFSKFLDFLKDDKLKNLTINIFNLNVQKESNDKEIQDLIKVIDESYILKEIHEKKLQQKKAINQKDSDLELKLTSDIIELVKKLKSFKYIQ